ncbi:MAG: DUF748 domain-containing protein [Chthoniobacterales bacterium]
MKKMTRVVLLLAGGLFVLLAVALLAVNIYVQSHGTQARIQEELSHRLGSPLRIERISVTPWWGLKLTGITMPQTDARIPGDFLNADTFRMRIAFGSLFAGQLVIKEISLVRPKVTWAQNAAGKWRLPSFEPTEPEKSLPEKSASEKPSPAPLAAAPATSGPPPVEETESRPAEFNPEIRRVSLTNGSFHFLDSKGAPVASFDGLTFRSSLRSGIALRGNAIIKKISLRNRFFLQDLQSPLRYEPDELEFSQISAHAGGGEVTGQFHMLQTEFGSPFVATVNFHDVQVDRVVTEAGGPAGMLQGRIEGNLNANGKTADANALEGTGEIYLRDGEVRRYSLLVALGQLLQLEDLAQLHLDQAYVKYHITPGAVMVDDLMLSSPNMRLSAKGTIGFNGKLRLDSRLAVNEKVRSQLFRAVRDNFHPLEETGYAAVDFQVSGTIDHPKTNLMGQLIGPEVKDLGGIISTLLGGKHSKPKSEAARPNESPAAAPNESASPTP